MTRILAAVLVTAAALIAAPPVAADPQDLLPYCTGDQTPMNDNCRPSPTQDITDSSGLDPDLPMGLAPANRPVVGGRMPPISPSGS